MRDVKARRPDAAYFISSPRHPAMTAICALRPAEFDVERSSLIAAWDIAIGGKPPSRIADCRADDLDYGDPGAHAGGLAS